MRSGGGGEKNTTTYTAKMGIRHATSQKEGIAMKAKLVIPFVLALALCAGTAQANLISYGDFTGATLNADKVIAGTNSTYDKWFGRGGTDTGWHIVNDANSIDGEYARHFDHNEILFQGFTAGPGTYELSFLYAYEAGFGGDWAKVEIRGLVSPEFVYIHDPSPDYGDVLFTGYLSYTGAPLWESFSDTFQILPADSYDAYVLIFYSGAFLDGSEPAPGLRGIDSVSINAVSEPSAILLLGSGLVGLVGYRRRKRMM